MRTHKVFCFPYAIGILTVSLDPAYCPSFRAVIYYDASLSALYILT